MKLDHLLYARDDCIISCPDPSPCACAADETCVQINRSCSACSANQCIPNGAPTQSSASVSTGVLAGAIVATLVIVTAIGLFAWWYRRRVFRKKATAANPAPKEAPARAEDVLNRPDPNEKPEVAEEHTYRVYSASNSTINLDPNVLRTMGQAIGSPEHSLRGSVQSNPFEDSQSIQTTSTSTQGTNVIPIALVAPGSVASTRSSTDRPYLNPPRPGRTPDLDLNLDHPNASEGITPGSPHNQAPNAVPEPSNRNSYLSSMSSASDFLNEIPMIVTPTRGTVRQVLGVVKAEVIPAPPSSPTSESSLKPSLMSKPSIRSPLAGSSFGPADMLNHVEEETPSRQDPFDDRHSTHADSLQQSPTLSAFPASRASIVSDWSPDSPSIPWARQDDNSRPSSVSTQADSIIADIGSATRVQVGLQQLSPNLPVATPTTTNSSVSLHRMTSARLVSPSAQAKGVSALEQQQQKALVVARQNRNRISGASVLSTTSTKADSILESFHFVPPSPISDRPARVAPRSPLAQQPPANGNSSEPSSPLPAPPDRRMLGMSTGSEISTMSAGLGAFPFQMDSLTPPDTSVPAPAPASAPVDTPQRASLDTLALTSDLSSYPLGFDKELKDNYPLRKL